MRFIRLIIVTFVAASLIVVQSPARSHHRPSTYCSSSGDICQSTAKVQGQRRLQIRTFAKYFSRYRVCVTGPDGSSTCRRFRIERTPSHSFASSIEWRKHFPTAGTGSYTVTWFAQNTRVGAVLGFHR